MHVITLLDPIVRLHVRRHAIIPYNLIVLLEVMLITVVTGSLTLPKYGLIVGDVT